MKARDIVKQIVALGIVPKARDTGFRKSAFSFYRRRGSVVHVVNMQLSHGNFADQGAFYVNISLNFDELRILDKRPISEKPKEYECDLRRRLEDLASDAPSIWNVDSQTEISDIASRLGDYFTKIVVLLDPIDSVSAFLEQQWEGTGTHYGLLARMHYVLGDMNEARRLVYKEATFFKDRQGMSVQHLISRYGMISLEM
jgi:hypothetical protein